MSFCNYFCYIVLNPLFFRNIFGIERLPLQLATLVSNVPDLAWGSVSNQLGRWPTVLEEAGFSTFLFSIFLSSLLPLLKTLGPALSVHYFKTNYLT